MPCKDSTALIVVNLDAQERLAGFDFSKITCRKEIGGETGYLEYCCGKTIDELSRIEFSEVVGALNLSETEDQFFLYLEWDALRAAISQYQGQTDQIDPKRYQLESIEYGEDGVEIRQQIRPPSEMPKIVSCTTRSRQA